MLSIKSCSLLIFGLLRLLLLLVSSRRQIPHLLQVFLHRILHIRHHGIHRLPQLSLQLHPILLHDVPHIYRTLHHSLGHLANSLSQISSLSLDCRLDTLHGLANRFQIVLHRILHLAHDIVHLIPHSGGYGFHVFVDDLSCILCKGGGSIHYLLSPTAYILTLIGITTINCSLLLTASDLCILLLQHIALAYKHSQLLHHRPRRTTDPYITVHEGRVERAGAAEFSKEIVHAEHVLSFRFEELGRSGNVQNGTGPSNLSPQYGRNTLHLGRVYQYHLGLLYL
mmetsp:Transcript_29822/g.54773  ORF Transcript_29822/g.54773 Transcript_29822/m.54773 type:complete len:282 (-) Transcript_29822:358-1203(-)